MMKELLKPLNDSDPLTGGDGSGAGSSGALGDFASEALGQALSRQGGFGIADSIVHHLSRSGTAPRSAQVTGPAHFDTGMRKLK
jgi:Rod binding domain-containing protein